MDNVTVGQWKEIAKITVDEVRSLEGKPILLYHRIDAINVDLNIGSIEEDEEDQGSYFLRRDVDGMQLELDELYTHYAVINTEVLPN